MFNRRGLFDQVTLRGWKAIAQYLGCSVSTVKRHEKMGLVIRRTLGYRPFAFTFELDKFYLIYEQMRRGTYKKKRRRSIVSHKHASAK